MEISIKFLLSDTRLFQTLTHEESDYVEQMLVVTTRKQGTTIYKEGEHAKSVCFVAEGELDVIKKNDKGEDIRIATVDKGHTVGEMGIIDGMIRSATILAKTDVTLVIFRRADFEKIMIEKPDIAFKILHELARSLSLALRETSEDFANASVAAALT
ncbi:MAG: cyclic nucleotide-binding domain-containing protein [Pseudomonadales bacterium]|nr:cyclic nucleotide-binding domain-containing protein [Pseudomonadales bacterium]